MYTIHAYDGFNKIALQADTLEMHHANLFRFEAWCLEPDKTNRLITCVKQHKHISTYANYASIINSVMIEETIIHVRPNSSQGVYLTNYN